MLPVFDFPQQFLSSLCEAGAVLPPQPDTHPRLAPTPLPAQLPRKAGEAGLHRAAGAWGFRESQGKV